MSAAQERMLRDSETIPQQENGRSMQRSEISAYWKAKAHAYMREHTGDWLTLLGAKFSNFWNTYQYDDLSIIKILRDEGAVPPGFRFGFIAALGLAGIPLCWSRLPASRWIIGAVLLHVVSLLPVFVTERYRLAAAPGLILIAIGGLSVLWDSIAERKWTATLLHTAAFAAAAIFCTQSRAKASWALDFYKAGTRATQTAAKAIANSDHTLAAEALARAQRNLDTAYAHAPSNPEVAFAMGNLWMTKGDITRAEACYLQALVANPARPHEGALTNLGIAATRRGAWADAERYFSQSLQIEPSNPKVLFSLAESRVKLGDPAGALDAIERARALRPGHPEIEALAESLRKTKNQ